jgi:hypothetical protein
MDRTGDVFETALDRRQARQQPFAIAGKRPHDFGQAARIAFICRQARKLGGLRCLRLGGFGGVGSVDPGKGRRQPVAAVAGIRRDHDEQQGSGRRYPPSCQPY